MWGPSLNALFLLPGSRAIYPFIVDLSDVTFVSQPAFVIRQFVEF